MRKLSAILLLLLFTQGAFAREEQEKQNDENPYSYLKLDSDRWFAGAGVGAQFYFGDHNMQAKFKDLISPALDIYGGCWFNALIGLRAGLTGYHINGLTNGNHFGNNPYSTGETYICKNGDEAEKQQFDYFNLHADLFFLNSQLTVGKNTNMHFTFSPYMGLGWAHITNNPHKNSISANVGLYTQYELVKHVDIILDAKLTAINEGFDGDVGNRIGEGIFSITLGANYHF